MEQFLSEQILYCRICGMNHSTGACQQSEVLEAESVQGGYVFDIEQLNFLRGEGKWLIEKVLRAFETDVPFAVATENNWRVIGDRYRLGSQEEFYEKILRHIHTRSINEVKQTLNKNQELFYLDLANALAERGIRFLDETASFSMALAYYDPETRRFYFRPERISSDIVTLKHELIHGAIYNLPESIKQEVYRELERNLAMIRDYLKQFDEYDMMVIEEKYGKGEGNLVYRISNTDELIAGLTNSTFMQFLNDIQSGKVLEKKKKLKERILRKKEIFPKLTVENVLNKVFNYWQKEMQKA